jgi:aldose 1-epimerase
MCASVGWGSDVSDETVAQVRIDGGGLSATIVPWGAAIQDLRLAGHGAPLVLGLADPTAYRSNKNYLGAIAGRYANRIKNGQFTIDGERFQGPTNFIGKHTLHGGENGYSAREWQVAEAADDSVTLALLDADGCEGFPGALDVSVTYRLGGEGTLEVELRAQADRATLCNLAQHSYFNLDDGGESDVRGHRLQIEADAYLPVDGEMIPTGRVEPVEGGAFDFRSTRAINAGNDGLYDHNFCLSADRCSLRRVVSATGERSRVTMEVWTTEPGIQFYTGEYLEVAEGAGLDGRTYRPHAGFCLEPQTWPDSPNRPYFPQAILRPGKIYRQLTEYRFRLG